MDTSCLNTSHIPIPCLSVLTEIKSLSQAVMQIRMVDYSTTLKPSVVECHALPMIIRKNSTVSFAQSKNELNIIILLTEL